jgi:hypothetical protein
VKVLFKLRADMGRKQSWFELAEVFIAANVLLKWG